MAGTIKLGRDGIIRASFPSGQSFEESDDLKVWTFLDPGDQVEVIITDALGGVIEDARPPRARRFYRQRE